jgi:replicative DNA helicase
VTQMLTKNTAVAEVIGHQLELDDFYRPDCRLIFDAVVTSYYADEPVDPVVIGDRLATPLSHHWECEPTEVPRRLYAQAQARTHMNGASDHAELVKRHGTNRRILALCQATELRIENGDGRPEEIGDYLASEASKITTGSQRRSEVLPYLDVGRDYVRYAQRAMKAKAQGLEIAAYTGLKFVDKWTGGIGPGELMMVAGPPGVGKSAVCWKMAEGFARRQLRQDADRRVGTFMLSLEMPLVGSAQRMTQSMTGIKGERLREGEITDAELQRVIDAWKRDAELPIYWNFASNFRMSQMRALVVEAIRRHNVGLIVLDHFRMFDPDRRINNPNQEDEAKARFLKEDIAKDLNVAVLCLAHTVKLSREVSDGRPSLNDLRGSGQVAAHCDIVAFMHVPHMFATDEEKAEAIVKPTDAELIFRKNRSMGLGTSEFYFDPSRMDIRDYN